MLNRQAGVFNQQNSADLGSEQADEEMTSDLMGFAQDDSHPDDDDEETQRRQQGFVSVRATGGCPLDVAPNLGVVESVRVEDEAKKYGDSNSEVEPLAPMKRSTLSKAAGLRKFDYTKTIDCRKLRKSRCTCRGSFKHETVSCLEVEKKCRACSYRSSSCET